MARLWGAARSGPFAARALGLRRAFTGRTLSTVPAKPLRLDPQLESVLSRFRAKGGPNEKEGAARLVEEFDRLQSRKVMRVLLVCSDYDSYTFEEDGLLTELVDAEYSDNHLRKPPTIERVSTPEKAIALHSAWHSACHSCSRRPTPPRPSRRRRSRACATTRRAST